TRSYGDWSSDVCSSDLDRGEQQGLDEELHGDVARPRPDRLAQANLPGPFAHRHEHDVGDADPADEQRDPGDRGEYPGQHAEHLRSEERRVGKEWRTRGA